VTTKDARSEFERRLAEDRKRIKKQQEERAREAAAKEAAERAERQKKAQEALKMLEKEAKEKEAKEKKPERPVLPTTHVVEAGDTLSAIALKYYGNAALWTEIYKVNKKVIGDNPSRIFVGQKLTIPRL